jgi:hypothetical protein
MVRTLIALRILKQDRVPPTWRSLDFLLTPCLRYLRKWAISDLARSEDPRTWRKIGELLLDNHNDERRERVVELIVSMGQPSAISLAIGMLVPKLVDLDERVRDAAKRDLSKLDPLWEQTEQAQCAVAPLLNVLRLGEGFAVEPLAAIGGPTAVGAIVGYLKLRNQLTNRARYYRHEKPGLGLDSSSGPNLRIMKALVQILQKYTHQVDTSDLWEILNLKEDFRVYSDREYHTWVYESWLYPEPVRKLARMELIRRGEPVPRSCAQCSGMVFREGLCERHYSEGEKRPYP